MSDVGRLLERVRNGLVPAPDEEAFVRLIAYRKRRAMRRRATAVTIALAVALAGFAVMARAFRSGPTPAATPTPVIFSPHEVATIRVGPRGETHAIVAADGSVWVTAHGVEGGGGLGNAAMFRIDSQTNRVVATVPMTGAPVAWAGGEHGLAFADGSIWVAGGWRPPDANQEEALLQRVDPSTNRVSATVPLGGRWGSDVAGNASGIWVGIRGEGHAEVIQVDPVTNAIVSRIPLESNYVWQVAATDAAVIVEELVWGHKGHADEGPCGVLTVIDPATASILTRHPVGEPCGFAQLVEWDGRVWASEGDRFVPLDPQAAEPMQEAYAFEPGHGPRSFLIPDETGIWYAAYPGANGNGPDRLTRLDPRTEAIEQYIEVGGLNAVILDGSLWILDLDGVVTRIDLYSKDATPSPTTDRITNGA